TCPTCGQRLQIPGPAVRPSRNRTVLGSLLAPARSSHTAVASPAVPAPPPSPASFVTSCPACGGLLQIVGSQIGNPLRCPRCGPAFTINANQGAGPIHTPCPGCRRANPLQPYELSRTIECSRCHARFIPAQQPAPAPDLR